MWRFHNKKTMKRQANMHKPRRFNNTNNDKVGSAMEVQQYK